MKKGTIIKLFTALVLVFALCACGNKKAKVDEALQGRWINHFGSTADIGAYFQFTEGKLDAGVYLYGEATSINQGTYEITDTQIVITYDYIIKADGTKVPNSEPSLTFDYTYEGETLTLSYEDEILEKK